LTFAIVNVRPAARKRSRSLVQPFIECQTRGIKRIRSGIEFVARYATISSGARVQAF
jgi:hypothetical protein